jgi:hypothetical protein
MLLLVLIPVKTNLRSAVAVKPLTNEIETELFPVAVTRVKLLLLLTVTILNARDAVEILLVLFPQYLIDVLVQG